MPTKIVVLLAVVLFASVNTEVTNSRSVTPAPPFLLESCFFCDVARLTWWCRCRRDIFWLCPTTALVAPRTTAKLVHLATAAPNSVTVERAPPSAQEVASQPMGFAIQPLPRLPRHQPHQQQPVQQLHPLHLLASFLQVRMVAVAL